MRARLLLLVGVVTLLCHSLVAAPPTAETSDSLMQKARAVLSRIDGETAVPGLKDRVEVLRDQWGVPHIYAKNQDDLFFAQGYVVAQDRLFQLDMWRRVAVGETAEVLGKERLDGDRMARLLLYRGDMDAEWASYGPDTRQIATAFTNGINASLDTLGDRLPIEFQLLGYRPRKWKPEDVLGRMAGVVMSRNFGQEVSRAHLIASVGLEKARRLSPTDPPRQYAPVEGLDLAGIDRTVLSGYTAAIKALKFQPDADGSNNWVIDGTLSASGKPLLANDPHRAITLPALRYLVHLHAPGWNAIGSGEPALPGIAIGHNDRIAWGFTIVGTDQADLYVEDTKLNDPTHYRVGDGWVPMKIIREKVSVKGQAQPVDVELRYTRHGPVIHQDEKRHRAYALRWVGAEPGGAGYLGGLALSRARNWPEFLEACKSWKLPAENIVYADVEGNIGWIAAGLTPIRKNWDGLLPIPGASSQYEWQGFLPVAELPQVFNPPSHYVATANHNVLPKGYDKHIAYDWSLPTRFHRIKDNLEAKKRFDLTDFQALQHDEVSIPGQALAKLAKTIDLQAPSLRPHLDVLSAWDGRLSLDSRAGPVYAAWLKELLDEFYRPHIPKELLESVRGGRGLEVMLAALEKPDAVWFGENPSMKRDALLRDTLTTAVRKVQERLPGDSKDWTWGRLHTATLHHPLATLGPVYEKAFNLGPVPRTGDAHTPNNTRSDDKFQQTHGASYRHLFDVADWDRGLATSVPGQSGQPGSPHYGDLLPLWAKGQYFPLLFSRPRVEEQTRHRLVLRPV